MVLINISVVISKCNYCYCCNFCVVLFCVMLCLVVVLYLDGTIDNIYLILSMTVPCPGSPLYCSFPCGKLIINKINK